MSRPPAEGVLRQVGPRRGGATRGPIRASVGLPAALFLVIACGTSDGRPDSHRPDRSTREMAAELQRVYREMSAAHNPYLNARRVELLRSLPEPADPAERLALRGRLAEELLYAGDVEAAIAIFEEVEAALDAADAMEGRDAAPSPGDPAAGTDEARHRVETLLALAWLRLGEQENCLANPAAAACIVPLEEEGWHRIETGSRNAIRYLGRMLERDPGDLNARWLLNLAHMTLGEYPDGVAEEWRIPPAAFEPEDDIGRFWDVGPQLGVDVVGLSGGAIADDFTGNGHLDLMASSWHLTEQLRLFENQGDGSFREVTGPAGLEGITGGLHLVHGDYTNNGLPDVLVLRGAWMGDEGLHPNSLLRNNGDGTFTDVTLEAGLGSRHPTQTAVWADFDNDGRLDLYVGNETTGATEHPAQLFLNNGDGTFREVGREAGVAAVGFIKGVDAGDFDNDGRPDLYVSRLGEPNLLFRNEGVGDDGIPRFEEVGDEAGVREPLHSFPVWFWDFDNDGWLDLFVSGYRIQPGDVGAELLGQETQGELPRLYRNEGDGTFTDVTEAQGLNRILYTMGSNFGDFDNDGWLDLLVGTGDPELRALMPNRAFRSDGGRGFREITTSGGFGNVQKGHAVAFADVNNDGLQDIYMNLGGALEGDAYRNAFYRNPGQGNDWITLRFRGVVSNRLGVGVRVRLVVEGPDGATREIHRVGGGGGSFGGNSLQKEIGLGPSASVREVEVHWPASGVRQRFVEVEPNRIYEVHEDGEHVVPVAIETYPYRLDGSGAHGPDDHHDPENLAMGPT